MWKEVFPIPVFIECFGFFFHLQHLGIKYRKKRYTDISFCFLLDAIGCRSHPTWTTTAWCTQPVSATSCSTRRSRRPVSAWEPWLRSAPSRSSPGASVTVFHPILRWGKRWLMGFVVLQEHNRCVELLHWLSPTKSDLPRRRKSRPVWRGGQQGY